MCTCSDQISHRIQYISSEEFDYFHEAIIHAELARASSRAVVDGLLAGLVIGLPPILNYGSLELYKKIVPDCLAGKKYLALAISEAFAGSDVGGLQTTAVRDGDYWIVTGTKKWITNGTFADYFTTGCKTEVFVLCNFNLRRIMVYTSVRLVLRSC